MADTQAEIDKLDEGEQAPKPEAQNPYPRLSRRWKDWNKARNEERYERERQERQREGQSTDNSQ